MTQSPLPSVPTPPVPKSSHRNRNTGIAALVIGLVIGLALGIFISPILLPKQTGAGTNNQVQVSGTIQEEHPSEIHFASIAVNSSSYGQISSSSLIINGQYSVVLVGGQSYDVRIYYQPVGNSYPTSSTYSLYVPSGVTTFTADF
jgi:hypothetical protein